jgi:hypothetical protein
MSRCRGCLFMLWGTRKRCFPCQHRRNLALARRRYRRKLGRAVRIYEKEAA